MRPSVKKHIKVFTSIFVAVLLFTMYIFVADKALSVREFEVQSAKIPAAFDGFRIAHVSDLHNTQIGKDNIRLIEKLKETEPDIIAVTGDIIDSRRTDISVAEDFFEKAVKIAPVYFVTGNHESRISAYVKLAEEMKGLGVTVLENEKAALEKNGESIILCGIDDPAFSSDYLFGDEESVVASSLEALSDNDSFTVLLSHRPEFFELYLSGNFDLVLSGHAHGGQLRLPFIGGFFAPGQGFFPEFDSGLYKENSTSMIVSRGIGNSIVPLRFNNRPEIIVAVLKEGA